VSTPFAYLRLISIPLHEQGRDVELTVTTGRPRPGIVEVARDVDLIVMATHGSGASRMALGRTANHVVHRAGVPTIMIGRNANRARPFARLAVPLDGSAEAEAALPVAAMLHEHLGIPSSWCVSSTRCSH
jgi:hypothetical protein